MMKLMLIIRYKASLSLNKSFFPEKPKDWNNQKYLEDANYMFDSITNLINKKFILIFQKKAKMLIGYDCWVEQVEENWQLKILTYVIKNLTRILN